VNPIVLLTDFGSSDWYVAEMKGVLLAQAPGAPLVDITHAIPPGDIARAAFVLARAHEAFAEGTVFVAVVDPGVGTDRHPLAVHAFGQFFVGPDNGVLEAAYADPDASARLIADAKLLAGASATFHGRDVFAPAAARIALGGEAAWRKLGPTAEVPVRLAWPWTTSVAPDGEGLVTQVAHVDRFGNAITALGALELEAWLDGRDRAGVVLRVHGARGEHVTEIRGLSRTYGDSGETPIALVGSSGLVEIAIPGGHAGLRLGLAPGDLVALLHAEDS
jgi:S-adenosyl-L-methionine hydrolase (adenosine-forming)